MAFVLILLASKRTEGGARKKEGGKYLADNHDLLKLRRHSITDDTTDDTTDGEYTPEGIFNSLLHTTNCLDRIL
ncbi:hypothetical protein ScPMuIL_018618 [Solemya velum]